LNSSTSKVGFFRDCVKIVRMEMIFNGIMMKSILIEKATIGKVHIPSSNL
jgi:hypothetical protein